MPSPDLSRVDLSRAAVEAHSIDLHQFIDFRAVTLANGMRAIDAYNASGLTFTVLPDRGLDVWLAAYNGRPLTWISQGAPHAPDFGASWLRQFNGGLLVTCGLRHVGPPEQDERSGELRDLHGDYTRLRAGNLAVHGAWQDGRYVLELTGTVAESLFFGDQLRLTRTIRMTLGEPALEIHDVVANLSDTPAPLMLLHHFNFGYPLVQDGVQLHVPTQEVHPRDMAARAAFGTWERYSGAIPRHLEEVHFHRVFAGPDGRSLAALAGEDFGLQIEWDTTNEPFLTQWKNFRRGVYVCGVEPGNCVPEGQNRARRQGRLAHLEPGEQRTFTNKLTVLPDAEAVGAMRNRVAELRTGGAPVTIDLADYEPSEI
jgi:galactose mutarotase-like enzyme